MFDDVLNFIRSIYGEEKSIPLHRPIFVGNEKQYLNECIDSSYVSSVGKFVERFEENIAKYTGTKFAIATSNGTSALHISLLLGNVQVDDEVITQPLSFIATSNAISYCGAKPIFLDVDKETMGLSPRLLKDFLEKNTLAKGQDCINKLTGKVIRACLPVHTFGHPCKIKEIKEICDKYNIFLIEDAAESLGSFYKGKHTGTFGKLGVISFNGNKIITGGGGGCIITNDEKLAKKAKHITTTAKLPHKWEFSHDMIAYNYRMPNINAALLIAQLENLDDFLLNKKQTAMKYKSFCRNKSFDFFDEPADCKSNFWLNSIILNNKDELELFLTETNSNGIMTRPLWKLINKSVMYHDAYCDDLTNSEFFADRVVNLPSSVIKK